MTNKMENMLIKYDLSKENSIFSLLGDFQDEAAVREYCWRVLRTYPDLKKEDWSVGMEGGDYIYSFDQNYIFITDDIWSFNLIAKQPVLELLAAKIKALNP